MIRWGVPTRGRTRRGRPLTNLSPVRNIAVDAGPSRSSPAVGVNFGATTPPSVTPTAPPANLPNTPQLAAQADIIGISTVVANLIRQQQGQQDVAVAIPLLQGNAEHWWEVERAAHPDARKYAHKFHELGQFCLRYMIDDRDKARKFEQGLRPDIRDKLCGTIFTTYLAVYMSDLKAEAELNKQAEYWARKKRAGPKMFKEASGSSNKKRDVGFIKRQIHVDIVINLIPVHVTVRLELALDVGNMAI
nr:uncharacterized protein LOC109155212 [Ipomoea batatas]